MVLGLFRFKQAVLIGCIMSVAYTNYVFLFIIQIYMASFSNIIIVKIVLL